MFQSPGSRSHVGSDGQEKFKNQIAVGGNIVANSTGLLIGNAAGGVLTGTVPAIQIGNSTSQTLITTVSLTTGNSTANSFINSSAVALANSTANTTVGVGTLTLAGAGSNAGLIIGTSVKATNGYTFLPNGLLLQWGTASSSSTSANLAFPIAFPTGCYSISVADIRGGVANLDQSFRTYISAIPNTSVFTAASGNATANAFYWMAIGH